MYFKLKGKVCSLLVTVCVLTCLFALLTVNAAVVADSIEVVLTDVTNSNTLASNVKTGDVKIQVSIKGNVDNVTSMQVAFDVTGDLDYTGVTYLVNNDAPADAKVGTKLTVGFALFNDNAITFEDETPVFILNFHKDNADKNDSVTVNVDNEHSFCHSADVSVYAKGESSITAKPAENAKETTSAVIKIQMNKVPGFVASNESGVTVKITDQSNGDVIKESLNSQNRDDGTNAEFTITNTVIKGNKYTVEVSGLGYKTYTVKNVSFDNKGFVLTIDNTMFVPGDVNKDGEITVEDKQAYEKLISNDEYNASADFDRNGYVDENDNVFEIEVQKTVPGEMTKPGVSGGKNKITVSWTVPEDNGGSEITGYTIKYGTSKTSLNKTVEIANSGSTSKDISGLLAGTTYYVKIAAKNEMGTGAFSEIAEAKTDTETPGGGGGGGFGGGGAGGGTATQEPESSTDESEETEKTEENEETEPGKENESEDAQDTENGEDSADSETDSRVEETFEDLGNYDWAKDSIYTLKQKGIISGISEKEYAPANNIKRGDFILILTRMLSINDTFSENFEDVPQDSYYYNAIGSARAAGIASGDGKNFMPANTITRQDLITLAYRAFLAKGYIEKTEDMTSLDEFADKDNISEYAKTAMASMVKAGIIKGSNGNVNPLGNATRAEVAVMCARLVELIK